MRQREEIIKAWLDMWLGQELLPLEVVFTPDVHYYEFQGREYEGIDQIRRWFETWNKMGSWSFRTRSGSDIGTFLFPERKQRRGKTGIRGRLSGRMGQRPSHPEIAGILLQTASLQTLRINIFACSFKSNFPLRKH